MKNNIKIGIGSIALLTFVLNTVSAQQWTGNNNATDAIWRSGNIGIGINNSSTKRLWVQANSTDHIGVIENAHASGYGLLINSANDPLRVGSLGDYTGNRFIVKSDGNVGIGTFTPSAKLQVFGAGGPNIDLVVNGRIKSGDGANGGGMWVDGLQTLFMGQASANSLGFYNGGWRIVAANNGKVGVGTISPTAKLHVFGDGGGNVDLPVNGRITTGDAVNSGGIWLNSDQTLFVGQFSATSAGFYNAGNWRMIVDNTGNVGIGTTSPDAKLAVKGTVHAQEVKVDLNVPGPDYVFEENYNLPSLTETENYIKQNKHLSEVPSAKEMEANGINLSEMKMILLKKVEELTLLLIESDKKFQEQERVNDEHKQLLEKILLQISKTQK